MQSRAAENGNTQYLPEWKPSSLEEVDTHKGVRHVKDIMRDLDNHTDAEICAVIEAATKIKNIALEQRSKASSASWKKFCIQQLSKGAGRLHSWANRPNSLPSVPLFDSNTKSETPLVVLQDKTDHWAAYWQKPFEHHNADDVLRSLTGACVKALAQDSEANVFDMPEFTTSALEQSAKKYKKVSKGRQSSG